MVGRGNRIHSAAIIPLTASALLLLGLKMAIAATIVVTTSVIAEKSRPFMAAMIATLPVSAGPALVFLALDHDDAFLSGTLMGAMSTNMATAAYCLAYAVVAQRAGTVTSLGAALGAWGLASLVLRQVEWTLLLSLAATIVVYAVAIPLVQRFLSNRLSIAPPRAWYAIPLRALAVACLVAAVTTLSWTLGPYYSGVLAALPIVLSSLIAILQPRIGGPQTAAMIGSSLVGLLGFGFALAASVAAVPDLGRFWALGLGLAVCLVWNGALVVLKRRKA